MDGNEKKNNYSRDQSVKKKMNGPKKIVDLTAKKIDCCKPLKKKMEKEKKNKKEWRKIDLIPINRLILVNV